MNTSGSKRLTRSTSDRMVAGVAGGLANYFGLDPVIVRVLFVALAIFGGGGIILYLVCWVLMPEE
jgi:phage shock protein C